MIHLSLHTMEQTKQFMCFNLDLSGKDVVEVTSKEGYQAYCAIIRPNTITSKQSTTDPTNDVENFYNKFTNSDDKEGFINIAVFRDYYNIILRHYDYDEKERTQEEQDFIKNIEQLFKNIHDFINNSKDINHDKQQLFFNLMHKLCRFIVLGDVDMNQYRYFFTTLIDKTDLIKNIVQIINNSKHNKDTGRFIASHVSYSELFVILLDNIHSETINLSEQETRYITYISHKYIVGRLIEIMECQLTSYYNTLCNVNKLNEIIELFNIYYKYGLSQLYEPQYKEYKYEILKSIEQIDEIKNKILQNNKKPERQLLFECIRNLCRCAILCECNKIRLNKYNKLRSAFTQDGLILYIKRIIDNDECLTQNDSHLSCDEIWSNLYGQIFTDNKFNLNQGKKQIIIFNTFDDILAALEDLKKLITKN